MLVKAQRNLRLQTLAQLGARQISTYESVGTDYKIEDSKLQRTPEKLLVEQPWTSLPFQ